MNKTIICIAFGLVLILCASALFAANDRPMIYGQNPIPTDWWGYDKYTYDPVEFTRMQESGCTSARLGVNWDQIEPTRGVRNWAEIDRWIKLCMDKGINPVVLINSTPTWALPEVNPEIASPEARYPAREDCLDDFNSFVYELARRYRGCVQYYEYWNEANGYGWHWDEGFNRADEYTPWMIRAYKMIKLADPSAEMSTTGMDDNGGGGDYFLQQIYNYGGKGYFDAVADHPYSTAELEEWKLSDIRTLLDTSGDSHVKIWITEMGWVALAGDIARQTTVAGYINDCFDKLVNNHPTVTAFMYHTAMDFPWEKGYGLIDRYFSAKRTWTAFRDYAKPARPLISNISVTHLSASSVRIDFDTDMPSKSVVIYGLTDMYGMVTGKETTAVTSHSFTLIGLNPSTTYHYRIRTAAVDYGDTYSSDLTFTTNSGPVVHITSGPTVNSITDTTAVISWTTDVPATAEIQCGVDLSYGNTVTRTSLEATHTLQITGLQPGTNYQFRVISGAPGYADAAKEGTPFTTEPPYGVLQNGSFEDGSAGWTFWEVYPWGHDGDGDGTADYPGHVSIYTNNGGAYPPSPAAMHGSKRLTIDRGYASAVGGLYQTVKAQNGTYIVSGWVASGCDTGDELIELRAIDGEYTGGIPGGTAVASLTESSSWIFYSAPVRVTTGKLTIATRASQWTATNAVAGHFDGIEIAMATEGGLGLLKSQSSGALVSTEEDKIVTMVVDANTFYIQEDDRSSGIRVQTTAPHGLSMGDRTFVAGTLGVIGGEAVIREAWAYGRTSGTMPDPLGLTNRALGGAENGIQPGITGAYGLNNTGLLIRAWGAYTRIDDTHFMIDDGSGVELVCVVPSGVSLGSDWDYVTVTGISSCYSDDSQLKRLIRVRGESDIAVHLP